MFKRLFLGTTQIDFKDIGPRFYKIFVVEMLIFGAILIASLFGVLSLNLSVDFDSDNNFAIKGLWTINETKLKNLDEKSISKLNQKGFLQHI